MVNVEIFRDKQANIQGLEIKGHAGYAEHGSDVVCAAASVTAYTAAGALEELAGLAGCYSEKDGYFNIQLPDNISEKQKNIAAIILETAAIGFKQINLSYSEFLSVKEKEV
jgi:uncharacterized protein YsxB (DUF464 family)